MASPNFTLNASDLKSAIRHAVFPIAGAAIISVAELLRSGSKVNMDTATNAALMAIAAGIIRLIQRWVSNIPGTTAQS